MPNSWVEFIKSSPTTNWKELSRMYKNKESAVAHVNINYLQEMHTQLNCLKKEIEQLRLENQVLSICLAQAEYQLHH